MYKNFILVDLKIKENSILIYKSKEKLQFCQQVIVEVKNKLVCGFVIYSTKFKEKENTSKYKEVKNIFEKNIIITKKHLKLAKWISNRYIQPFFKVIKNIYPFFFLYKVEGKLIKKRYKRYKNIYVKLKEGKYKGRKTKYYNIITEILKNNKFVQLDILSQIIPKNIIKNYEKKELIEFIYLDEINLNKYKQIDIDKKEIELNQSQKKAINEFKKYLSKKLTFKVFYLYGKTGSGKTQVYLNIINYLNKLYKKQAKILLPQITIADFIYSYFIKYSDIKINLYHSNLQKNDRYTQILNYIEGKTNILIGTRSSLFYFNEKTSVIVIDEEHSETYKQENSPHYHTIPVALYLAKILNIPIILVSATPSVENYYNIYKKRFKLIEIKQRENIKKPAIKIIDMKKTTIYNDIISEPLYTEIKKALKENKKIILYLNRRGFSNYIHCNNCNYTAKCRYCNVSLTYHKDKNLDICHLCGFQQRHIEICPVCNNQLNINKGIGTQQLQEKLNQLFKFAKIERLDSDSASNLEKRINILNNFISGNTNILIGTSMITQGIDFKKVSLIGILNIDSILNLPDFSATEKAFQNLKQIIGRSGRDGNQAKIIIQTYDKNNEIFTYIKEDDIKSFYKKELIIRKEFNFPPYKKLINITLSCEKESILVSEINKLKTLLEDVIKDINNVEILGPAKKYIYKLKNKFRYHILIKTNSYKQINPLIYKLSKSVKLKSKIVIDIDVKNII